MWEFYANNQLLYRSGGNERQALYDIKLIQRLNSAGELTFTMPPSNALFDSLSPLTTEIICQRDGETVWCGRIVRMLFNMQKELVVECEGALSYLSDAVLPPYMEVNNAKGLISYYVQQYNASVGARRAFEVGVCNGLASNHIFTLRSAEPTTVFDELTKLIKYGDVFFQVRCEGHRRYLDFLKISTSAQQEVQFGRNLLDFSDELDASDVYTIGYPVGKTPNGDIIDISSVNDDSPFLLDEAAMALYGKIYRIIETNERTPKNVKRSGETTMSNRQLIVKRLTCSAVDLADFGIDVAHFRLGDLVRVISAPHGVNISMVLSEITHNIPNAEKTVYNIGHLRSTLTGALSAARRSVAPAEGDEE